MDLAHWEHPDFRLYNGDHTSDVDADVDDDGDDDDDDDADGVDGHLYHLYTYHP